MPSLSKKYSRVVLKCSGEALGGTGFDRKKIDFLVQEIKKAQSEKERQIVLVLGGGNIWRGKDATDFGFSSACSDAIGMGATLLNAAVFQQSLLKSGILAKVFSPHSLSNLSSPYILSDVLKTLESGTIALCAGGTGSPFFTTDSAAVLRALEVGADAMMKGTKVNGVFDCDPMKNPHAQKYDRLTYNEALNQKLHIMDMTAFTLAQENELPIYVFDIFQPDALANALAGRGDGTWICG